MESDDAQRLLDCYWAPRSARSEEAHYWVATRFTLWNQGFSLAIVILAAITGSGLFVTLGSHNQAVQWTLAVVSLVTALIAGIQRSLQYASRSARHQAAGADWGPVVNVTEELGPQLKGLDPAEIDHQLDALRAQMDKVTRKSPQIPQRVFEKFGLAATYEYRVTPACGSAKGANG